MNEPNFFWVVFNYFYILGYFSGRTKVLIEVDCGGKRTGCRTTDDAVEIALKLSPEVYQGVMTHAGQSYWKDKSPTTVSVSEKDVAIEAAKKIKEKGLESKIISVGSTPTAVHVENLDGITEMRPGNTKRKKKKINEEEEKKKFTTI